MAITTHRRKQFIMIDDPRWGKRRGRLIVTSLAVIGTGKMASVLAGGKHTVMTTHAVAENIGVINGSTQPGGGAMAYIAFVIGWHMSCGFTAGSDAVVT